ncbi:hypothetical protein MMC22_005844 [Lobaria immixta]|nr:hypothetical protein [Lobaria immixta]
MQTKLFLTVLLFSAASPIAVAKDSTEDVSTTAPPSLNTQQVTTEAEYIAVNKYFETASVDLQSELNKENVDFGGQLRTTNSVKLPAYITAIPSSLQGYMSSVLEDVAKVFEAAKITTAEGKSSATDESTRPTFKTTSTITDTRSTMLSTGTQTGASSTCSGKQSNTTSSGSGSSTTAAPTLSASSQNTTSTTATSSSSPTGNAATQPTGALSVVGALVFGVIGLVGMA